MQIYQHKPWSVYFRYCARKSPEPLVWGI